MKHAPATEKDAEERKIQKREKRACFYPEDLIDAGVGSRNKVYEALRAGEIPATKIGKRYIVKPEWVHEYTDL